jgi:hypothetical protein
MPYSVVLRRRKLGNMGWHAFVNTEESIRQSVEELTEMRMVPKIG